MSRNRESTFIAFAGALAALTLLCGGCGEASHGGGGSLVADNDRTDADAPSSSADGQTVVDRSAEPAAGDAASTATRRSANSSDAESRSTSDTPAPRARRGMREITFDTLKFDIEKGERFVRSMLAPSIEQLDGQRVRIRGYMLPSFQQSGIKQFVLVRDNLECCFGPGAALYDCVIVEMVDDQSCSFSVRPIAVEGTFAVREFKGPDDSHLAIFHLAAERVR
jgi:hypothetical protein